jgi:hypothetical protein
VRLDPKTGQVTQPASMPTQAQYWGGKVEAEGGIMDGSWTLFGNKRTGAIGNRRSGNAFTLGKTTANLMAWNDTLAVSPAGAISRAEETSLWSIAPSRNSQTEAMALAGNVVVAAGKAKGDLADTTSSFLRVSSVSDGGTLAEYALDAPPTYDGLAIAHDRVYLSLQNGDLVCWGKTD